MTISNILRKWISLKSLRAIFFILLSAILGFYVNHYLSHSKPILVIEKVDFFYSFPTSKDDQFSETLLTIDDKLLELDSKCLTDFNLAPITPLIRIKSIFEEGKKFIDSRYNDIKQNLDVLIRLLSQENPSQIIVASFFLDLVETSLVSEYLNYLSRQKLVKFKKMNTESIIEKSYVSGIGIQLSPVDYLSNKYIYSEDPSVTMYRAFVFDLAAFIIEEEYRQLLDFLKPSYEYCDDMKRLEMDIFDRIEKISNDKLPNFRKIRVLMHAINNSDFPVSFSPKGKISLTDSYHNEVFSFNCELRPVAIEKIELEYGEKNYSPGNIYSVNIIKPKESKIFIIESNEPLGNNNKKIESLKIANSLETRITLKMEQSTLFQSNYVISDWVRSGNDL